MEFVELLLNSVLKLGMSLNVQKMTIQPACRGFTLVELAVVLAIVGLLLAAAMIPLSTQLVLKEIAETQRSMELVKEALYGYALVNGRLPCPAKPDQASGTTYTLNGVSTSAGEAEYMTATSVCNRAVGVLPWATLGLPENDSWGRRYTYRVSPAFADGISLNTFNTSTTTSPASPGNQTTCTPSTNPTQSSFAICTVGDIAIWDRSESTHTSSILAIGAAAIVISHGRNGHGAWQSFGTQFSQPSASSADETKNAKISTDSSVPTGSTYAQYTYFGRTRSDVSTSCSDTAVGSPLCEYDDIVAFIPSNILIGRMVNAGKLP